MNLEDIKKLVKDLEKLNLQPINVRQNFFDICGFPHYENVISNVIAYFLNNSTFGQLFLNAILECLKINDQEQFITDVEREVKTADSKRIDIIIETKNYVFAIENKIWAHDENQPYDSYKKYLQEKFADKNEQNKKLVLLSMFQDKTKSGCKLDGCIKYQDFLQKLKNNVGNYVLNASLEEMVLFRNFINNLENIMGNNLDNETIKELIKNSDILTNAFYEMYNYKRSVAKDFTDIVRSKFNISIKDSWERGTSKHYLECIESNQVLSDFSQYGKITISLWLSPDIYQIAIAFGKDNYLEPNIKFIGKDLKDGSSWWTIILMREHEYENELINLNKCIGEAESMIKEFKNNINDYFEKK